MRYKYQKIIFKYKNFIFTIIITLLVYSFMVYYKLFIPSSLLNIQDDALHWNMVTINTVFAGFMFTSLSLILGVMDSKTILRLEKGNYMEAIYLNINAAILCSVVSIISSLFIIFIFPNVKNYIGTINNYRINQLVKTIIYMIIPSIEILGLTITLINFLYSVKDLKRIIKSLRKNINTTSLTDNEVDSVLTNIVKKRKNR